MDEDDGSGMAHCDGRIQRMSKEGLHGKKEKLRLSFCVKIAMNRAEVNSQFHIVGLEMCRHIISHLFAK